MVSRKTVLVTGGAGFIGSHLVDRLLELDYRVVVLDDLSTGKLGNLPTRVNFHHTGVTNAAIENTFRREKPNLLFHLAAQVSVSHSMRNPLEDAEANILGTLRLMEASRRHGIEKFVYSSTGGALYGNPEYIPCREDHPIRPLSPYGLAKSVSEKYLELYHQMYRLNYAALRYGNVYGPRQDTTGEAGVVAIFSRAMLEGRQPVIFGNGEQERDFVYVKDVVEANLLALNETIVGPYNIGTGTGTSVNRIFEMLSKILRFRRAPLHSPARLGEVQKISLDPNKSNREMGWQPQTSLDKGLELTVAYFRQIFGRSLV